MSGYRERLKQAQWFWGITPAIFTFVVFAASVLHESLWEWLTIFHLQPYYADLVAVLAASDAHGAGINPYQIPMPLDPYGRPHVYGPWWLYLHKIGLIKEDALWLGSILAAVSVAVFTWLLRAKNHQQAVAASLLIASPPLLLAYERGNNDLIIVLIFIVAASLNSTAFKSILQAVLVGAAAVLKFYPLAALPLLFNQKPFKRGLAAAVFCTAGILITAYVWRSDFQQALLGMPKPQTIQAYGITSTVELWTKQGTWPDKLSLGAGIIISLLMLQSAGSTQKRFLLSMTETPANGLFIASGSMWVFCYFANTNYAYRIALFLPLAAGWFQIWRNAPPELAKRARNLILLLLLMTWAQVARLMFVLLAGEHYHFLGLVSFGIEHGLVLGLTAVIAAALLLHYTEIFRRFLHQSAT